MKLAIDSFKSSGKWYSDYSVPLSLEESLAITPSYDPEAWLDFFEKKTGYSVRSKEFTLFLRIEDQDEKSNVFCRYLIHPNQTKQEYIPLRSF